MCHLASVPLKIFEPGILYARICLLDLSGRNKENGLEWRPLLRFLSPCVVIGTGDRSWKETECESHCVIRSHLGLKNSLGYIIDSDKSLYLLGKLQ